MTFPITNDYNYRAGNMTPYFIVITTCNSFFYFRSQPCLLYFCPASETRRWKKWEKGIFRKKFKMIFCFPTAIEQLSDALSDFLSCL